MKKSRDCEPGQVQHQCLSSQMHISKNGQRIPINTFLNLVENLPRRTEAGVAAKGGLASYLTLWIQNRKSLKFICLWVQASRYFWQHSVCALNLWLGQSYGRTAVPHLGQISFGPWSYLETTDSMKTCCFLITSKKSKSTSLEKYHKYCSLVVYMTWHFFAGYYRFEVRVRIDQKGFRIRLVRGGVTEH